MGDIPSSPSYGVDISQLIHFVRVCSNVGDLNNRSNKEGKYQESIQSSTTPAT